MNLHLIRQFMVFLKHLLLVILKSDMEKLDLSDFCIRNEVKYVFKKLFPKKNSYQWLVVEIAIKVIEAVLLIVSQILSLDKPKIKLIQFSATDETVRPRRKSSPKLNQSGSSHQITSPRFPRLKYLLVSTWVAYNK